VSLDGTRLASNLFAGVAILSAVAFWSTPLPAPDPLAVVYLAFSLAYIMRSVIRIVEEQQARKHLRTVEFSQSD
jgi:hypothetical protein